MADSPETIVTAPWSARFERAVSLLLKREGGYVNHPNDPGGETNYGISLRFLKSEGRLDLDRDGRLDFDLDMDGDLDGVDIRMLTAVNAKRLYHECFWQRLCCDAMPSPIGEMVFDQAVNGGRLAGVKLLQQALNEVGAVHRVIIDRLVVDGILGPATLARLKIVVASLGVGRLGIHYRRLARSRYLALVNANPKLKPFLRGWLNRADELGRL